MHRDVSTNISRQNFAFARPEAALRTLACATRRRRERSQRRRKLSIEASALAALALACALSLSLARADVLVADGAASPPGKALDCDARRRPALAVGFTLSHIDVAPAGAMACDGGSRPGPPVESGRNVVMHYDDPAIANETRSALRIMAAQGASVVRDVLWYYHTEDRATAARDRVSPLGLAAATDGKLPDDVLRNLLAYIRDAQQAGYDRFYVALGVQGSALPQCRRGATGWGECFDARFLAPTWSVTRQVVEAVRLARLRIKVIFDIAIEQCYAPASGWLADRNKQEFTRYMVKNYATTFHDRNFIVSCGAAGGAVARADAALKALVQLYDELGVRPDSVDIHDYADTLPKTREILLDANRAAERLGVPLVIGETWFDNPNVYDAVDDLLRDGQVRPRDMIIWPGAAHSACRPDITLKPPFDMEAVRRKLGLSDPACSR